MAVRYRKILSAHFNQKCPEFIFVDIGTSFVFLYLSCNFFIIIFKKL